MNYFKRGQVVYYDGCEVTIEEVHIETATVRTKQGNLLHVRYEFLKATK